MGPPEVQIVITRIHQFIYAFRHAQSHLRRTALWSQMGKKFAAGQLDARTLAKISRHEASVPTAQILRRTSWPAAALVEVSSRAAVARRVQRGFAGNKTGQCCSQSHQVSPFGVRATTDVHAGQLRLVLHESLGETGASR